MGAFLPECGNNFGMPQVQLPIFPAGVTHINSEVAFEERDGKVYYFNGHLPVFVHEKSALATFRLFSTQLVINGNATQAEISRAFGVPLVTVKRYVKLYREAGAGAFFAPAKKRSASKLTEQVCQRERQKVGGQAALRSGSCVCGCDLNFGYQRRNRSSRSSLRTLVLVCSKR